MYCRHFALQGEQAEQGEAEWKKIIWSFVGKAVALSAIFLS